MVQSIPQIFNFDEFIEWYPKNSACRYELRRGVIVERPKPRGKHSEIAGFLTLELGLAIRQAQLPYFIPRECIVKPTEGESGYEPDVIVLDRRALQNETRWEKSSIITQGTSVRLIIEGVSTNWRDDYHLKLGDYEALGISEYWAVDYLGLGSRLHIGHPKRPTLSVYCLVDGEYEVQRFRGSEQIISSAFPDLRLTAEQIFSAQAS